MSNKSLNPFLTISEIMTAMNSTLDPDQVLEMILDHSIKFCSVESGSLMLLNNKDSILDIVTYRGHNPQIKKDVKLKIGQGITGLVASEARGLIVNDVSKNSDYISIKKEIQSEMAVPMIVEDVVIGVISLDSNRMNTFTEEHLKTVSILANQAALIFKNLQTFRNLEQKNKIQQVLIEIANKVTSSLDMEEVFQSIMELIEKNLKLEKGSLVLYDTVNQNLKLVAAIGISNEEIEKGIYQLGEGIIGKVYDAGEQTYIHSVADDPLFLNRVGYLKHFKNDPKNISLLSTPIISDGQVMGVLSVFLVHQKNSDTKTYLDFLQVVASFISQAIKIHEFVDDAKSQISLENISLKRELQDKYKFGSIIGRSRAMEKLFEKIKLVSDSKASVLITGESGTGKEMIASAIHYNSNRASKPFIKINCAAIPESLLESELFGHTKGSFTGAIADKKGKFELADNGTIFLDEIGEMDLNLQSKLLRVLQEREIEAVGSTKVKKINIRILAATNSNLEEQIAEKKFRADLYYRLNVVNVHTPALRDRTDDIPLLALHFIEKYSKENDKNIKAFTRGVQKILCTYTWPGNVRELENIIERAVVLTQNITLDETDFSEITEKLGVNTVKDIAENFDDSPSNLISFNNLDSIDGKALEIVVGEVESKLIQYALKKFRYTKTRVAKFLGINRNTLDKRIKELNIEY